MTEPTKQECEAAYDSWRRMQGVIYLLSISEPDEDESDEDEEAENAE